MVRRTRRKLLATIGGMSVIGLAGCGQPDDGGDNETTGTDGETPETETDDGMGMSDGETTGTETQGTPGSGEMANVRVAHMSPDAPNVDIYVDGSPVLTDVAFGTVSDYLELSPGTYAVTITPAGDESTVVFEDEIQVEAATYTVVAAGEIASDGEPFEPLILEDDDSDPGSGMARVTLVHVSPDAGPVDVTSNGSAVFDGIGFGETESTTVPAGDYTLSVRPDSDSNDSEAVAEFDVSLAGGTVYTAFATGYVTPDDEPADQSFDLVVEEDASY